MVLVNTALAMIDNSSFISGKGGTVQELQLYQYRNFNVSAELHSKHTVGGAIYLCNSSIEIKFENNWLNLAKQSLQSNTVMLIYKIPHL